MSDNETSFDDASCVSPQSPGSPSPTKKQNKETIITISTRLRILRTDMTGNKTNGGNVTVWSPLPRCPLSDVMAVLASSQRSPPVFLEEPRHRGAACVFTAPGSFTDTPQADKKDPQGNTSVTGFEELLQKQLKGKQMQKEMAEFIRERIKIEEEYAKNLAKLSQNSLAFQEEGTLGEAWAQLKKSLTDEAEVHLKFSSKLQSEVEKPLLNFRENFKKDMKKFDHHVADLRKQLSSRYAAVEK
ncbi:PREDICTED: growth arrest-specific protein 7, partial [Nanorana parkeri]|uniref:growth arrest-specific protein 7 n=1 Tax=Nanorana parkeri TaxID=125878 RepID=UPI0008546C4A